MQRQYCINIMDVPVLVTHKQKKILTEEEKEEKKSKHREYMRLRMERLRNESGATKYTRGPYKTKYNKTELVHTEVE